MIDNTNNQNDNDYQGLSRGIWWAKKHGYQMPALEQAMFASAGDEPLRESLRRWAVGLVCDHDFAKAVFGDEEFDEWGQGVVGIQAWARQVAVEMDDGKLMVADPDKHVVRYFKQREHDIMFDRQPLDPTATLDNPEIVEIQLKKMYGTIPASTHRLEGVRVLGSIPAWQWHLRQMVTHENPFRYLNDYITAEMNKPRRPEWRS